MDPQEIGSHVHSQSRRADATLGTGHTDQTAAASSLRHGAGDDLPHRVGVLQSSADTFGNILEGEGLADDTARTRLHGPQCRLRRPMSQHLDDSRSRMDGEERSTHVVDRVGPGLVTDKYEIGGTFGDGPVQLDRR